MNAWNMISTVVIVCLCALILPHPQAAHSSDVAERAVRAVVSAYAKVDSSTVPMDQTFYDGLLHLDDLDVTEVIMGIDNQLAIAIPDTAVGRLATGCRIDSELGTGQCGNLAPRQLVSLVKEVVERKEDKAKSSRTKR